VKQSTKKILLTGASGFVGQRFLSYNKEKYQTQSVSFRTKKVSEVNLEGIDTIVHLAGKAHQMQKIDDQIYFDVNYELTKALATKAKEQGVAHFVFISTIKVYGDNYKNAHLTLDKTCKPDDPYGESKKQAEDFLRSIETETFKVGIIRPPLVYGPGVKGNMIKLLALAEKNLPLPFGGIENKRSMVFLDNLIELINTVVDQKASGTFFASDQQPLSTSRLIELIKIKLNKEGGLFKMPNFLLGILDKMKPALVKRLFYSLTVDTKETFQRLNYTPPYTSEYGIEQMVKWYKENKV